MMERVKGIEPSSLAWEARALPLSYTRKERQSYSAEMFRHSSVAEHRYIDSGP
jgi:hypothetical protein